MKTLKCPQCGGRLTPSIGPLHPMEAIAAEMLEQGVIFRCSNCALYSTSTSNIKCPKCGKRTLVTSLEDPGRGQVGAGIRTGKILCRSCGWEHKMGSHP